MKQICIIMAVYNGERYLADQINSLLENSYPNFILHIFDDHSKDNSKTIIDEYANKYPNKIFAHYHTENHGVIRTFLEGAKIMEADYYMFCDQDDIWMPDKIRRSLAAMELLESSSNNLPYAIFSDAKIVNQNLQELAPSFQRQSGYHTNALDPAHILIENKLIGCTILFNHALWQMLTVFPTAIRMHDWWIALIGSFFGKIVYLDEPLLLYRQHEQNVIGSNSYLTYIHNRITHLQGQRKALYDTCLQAAAFEKVYHDRLSPEQKKLLNIFSSLPKANWLAKRYRIIRYHFFKSGLIRNIGVFLLI